MQRFECNPNQIAADKANQADTETVKFYSYHQSVTEALDIIGAAETLKQQKAILIKPNLVNRSAHPVTTSPECCEAVINYVRSCSTAEIVIAEGCGTPSCETDEIFDVLGYRRLAERYHIKLIDLNQEPLKKLSRSDCPVFPGIYLPKIAFTYFIISVPVLKAHSLATFTGALKNMIGFAPPLHYSGQYGTWKKALFHHKIHQAIIDLNRYRCADLTIMDASIGLPEYHLGGRACNPPVGKMVAGSDPLVTDRIAAGLLGLNWQTIPHLAARINQQGADIKRDKYGLNVELSTSNFQHPIRKRD